MSVLVGVFLLGLYTRLILQGHRSEVKANLQITPGKSLPVLINNDATVRRLEVSGCTWVNQHKFYLQFLRAGYCVSFVKFYF